MAHDLSAIYSTDSRTRAIWADHGIGNSSNPVAPSIHVATTFYPEEMESPHGPYVYSRISTPTRDRCEAVLGSIEGGNCVLYASGQAATYAALVSLKPNRLIATSGYHGSSLAFSLWRSHTSMDLIELDMELTALDSLREGDAVWIETPSNPYCHVYDIARISSITRACKATLIIDATFAPPPVQLPLSLGADIVMHSTTKFLCGHSDALGGALIVPEETLANKLRSERTVLGSVPGSLEVWLLLRSLRTLSLRVRAQCATASALAHWLNTECMFSEKDAVSRLCKVTKVYHPSLASHPGHAVAAGQMLEGMFGAVLSFELQTEEQCIKLPKLLHFIGTATSLGGVESLIDWRYQWDKTVRPTLLRFSVGLESFEDLKRDLQSAFLRL